MPHTKTIIHGVASVFSIFQMNSLVTGGSRISCGREKINGCRPTVNLHTWIKPGQCTRASSYRGTCNPLCTYVLYLIVQLCKVYVSLRHVQMPDDYWKGLSSVQLLGQSEL